MGTLERQVAVVTGASGGIGKEICRALAVEGADVVLQYLNDRVGAEAAAAAVEAVGRRAEVVKADIRKAAEARALMARAVERFDRLDILVNNAGVYPRSWAMEMSEEEWDLVMDTNLKGTFLCCQAAGRIMKAAGRGRIVNISSNAIRGIPRGAHYSASKAGILGLTRTLALEWAPEVLVNAVAPGIIDTPMPRLGLTEEQIVESVGGLPIPRIGLPEDVAAAVIYLVGPGASWITGQTVHVNGGAGMF